MQEHSAQTYPVPVHQFLHLCESIETAKVIGEAMQTVVNSLNIESALYISKINQTGPRVI